MFGPKEPIDETLVGLLAPLPDKHKKHALKTLAACEPTIQEISEGEEIHLLAVGTGNGVQPPDIVALTDSGFVEVFKRRVGRRFAWEDFGSLKTAHDEHLGYFGVWIQTKDGLMYSQGSVEWANGLIAFFVHDLAAVRAIDATTARLRTASGST